MISVKEAKSIINQKIFRLGSEIVQLNNSTQRLLSEDIIAEELPDGIENGDFVTNDKTDDFRKWLSCSNRVISAPTYASIQLLRLRASLRYSGSTREMGTSHGSPVRTCSVNSQTTTFG